MRSFSFVVACYDTEKYVAACLDSLVRQNYPADLFEIICVDDGSQDRSWEIIADYQKRFKNFIAVRTHNSGLEKTCNLGIRASRFEWIVRVDSDDMADLNLLDRLNKGMLREPGCDFYYCKNYVEFYSDEEFYLKQVPVLIRRKF
jgi:glycosyltransferase involved in cell wall biosynthesis